MGTSSRLGTQGGAREERMTRYLSLHVANFTVAAKGEKMAERLAVVQMDEPDAPVDCVEVVD